MNHPSQVNGARCQRPILKREPQTVRDLSVHEYSLIWLLRQLTPVERARVEQALSDIEEMQAEGYGDAEIAHYIFRTYLRED